MVVAMTMATARAIKTNQQNANGRKFGSYFANSMFVD